MLLLHWRQRVQGRSIRRARQSSRSSTASYFIDELVAILRGQEESGGVAPRFGRANELAVDHGSQRFHAGFSLGAVIREYDVLRECLLDLIRDRRLACRYRRAAGHAWTRSTWPCERDRAVRPRARSVDRATKPEPISGSSRTSFEIPRFRAAGGTCLQRRSAPQRMLTSSSRASCAISRPSRPDRQLAEQCPHTGAGEEIDPRRRGHFPARAWSLDVRDELSGDTEEKAISVRVDGEAAVQGDPRLIRSAVTNLLRNAAKYTRRGRHDRRPASAPITTVRRSRLKTNVAACPTARPRSCSRPSFSAAEIAAASASGWRSRRMPSKRIVAPSRPRTCQERAASSWRASRYGLPAPLIRHRRPGLLLGQRRAALQQLHRLAVG